MIKQFGTMLMFSLIVAVTITGVNAEQAKPSQILTCADVTADSPSFMQKKCSEKKLETITATPIPTATTPLESDKYLTSNIENMGYGKVINEADLSPEMRASLEASKAECRQWAAKGETEYAISMAMASCNSMNIRESNVVPSQIRTSDANTESEPTPVVKAVGPSLWKVRSLGELKAWFRYKAERMRVRTPDVVVAVRG